VRHRKLPAMRSETLSHNRGGNWLVSDVFGTPPEMTNHKIGYAPLHHEHINFHGRYKIGPNSIDPGSLRSLRTILNP
jgi:hypothetical protein